MKPLSSKGRLRWAVGVANGDIVPNLEDVENFISLAPWVLYDFTAAGAKPVRTPPSGWTQFFADMADNFGNLLEAAAAGKPLTPPKQPAERQIAVLDNKLNRYVERKESPPKIRTLASRVTDRLYNLTIEHGHLLAHCEAPARMKRGPRPTSKPKQKPTGECGKLFLGKKRGQLYCSTKCAFRAAGRRKAGHQKTSALSVTN